uniref:AB hydrolase-1 domain-containing protein n=1 Tax=Salix viminalis TaxID=40686 RepID=A0A6N2N7H5_SALVM
MVKSSKLENARVTALDMAASGVNTKIIQEVRTFDQYNEPLMEFMAKLPENEKVVLVGHSLGGLNLAFAMEKFPEKISLAIFLTAILPDTVHQPSYMLEKFAEIGPRGEDWLDTVFLAHGTPEEPHTCLIMGCEFMKCKPFNLSSAEDLALQMLLNRPGSMFVDSLSKAKKFTDERYGSVPRVYIVCTEDAMMCASFQRWMIEQNGVNEVVEIPADHMPVFSIPQELTHSLLELARKHA